MAHNRYIILLRDQDRKSINRVEKDFSVSITTSEDLSREHRSFDIINHRNAVLYKNLGMMVVDELDESHLIASLLDRNSPILYYEKEREFFPAEEISLVEELKTCMDQLHSTVSELETLIRGRATAPEPDVEMEWGLKAIGIDRTRYTGKEVNVCILDTGFDATHPDFKTREIEGKSFIDGEDWDKDLNGHGTHCAGIACGNVRSDNGKRYGVAGESNLKIAKVLSNAGKGTTGSIIDAIDWAITKQFRVISLSLAASVGINEKPSVLFETVGKKALDNNCLIIAAAGNDSNRPALPAPVSSPADTLSIMAIAAVDSRLEVARFSNGGINASTGGNINLCAPGVDIASSSPLGNGNSTGYKILSGTSMATPFVSGMAALYMEQFPQLSAREIWEILESKARSIQGQRYRDVGKGLVQAILS